MGPSLAAPRNQKRVLDPFMVGFRAFFLGKDEDNNPFEGRGSVLRESRSLWRLGWQEAKAHPEDIALAGLAVKLRQ